MYYSSKIDSTVRSMCFFTGSCKLSIISIRLAQRLVTGVSVTWRSNPKSVFIETLRTTVQLYTNEKIEIFDVIYGWTQILFENVEGYVNSNLLLSERIKTSEEEELKKEKQKREQK